MNTFKKWEVEDEVLTSDELIKMAKEIGYTGYSDESAAHFLSLWGYLVSTKERY